MIVRLTLFAVNCLMNSDRRSVVFIGNGEPRLHHDINRHKQNMHRAGAKHRSQPFVDRFQSGEWKKIDPEPIYLSDMCFGTWKNCLSLHFSTQVEDPFFHHVIFLSEFCIVNNFVNT